MKKLIFLIYLLSLYFTAQSQESDTLIYAQGDITSATTKEPVVSKISYKSLPYGSKAGFLSGSNFKFPLFDNEKYELTVVAPGYAPSKYMLDPAEANTERKVIKNIELGLPVSAVKVAEETHTVGKIMRLDNLIFNAGTSKIESSSYEELDHVVKMLKDNPKMIIQLEGHTDFQGSPTANMKLSQDRVDAVKNYLTSKGASKNSIKTKAFGGTQPISRENTDEAHKLNRRVEVRVLQN
ncbi:MAG TPA: OmpA family protein [Cyclobacteriaceae bacterium]|jgi:outer membrane protein OmpA-like peptidoglycan-associated protein|nr:OmpA family protein [Cyclobacteriaceae bacterium]